MCTDMCIDMCTGMFIDMCTGMCTGMFIDMCTGMCTGMCKDSTSSSDAKGLPSFLFIAEITPIGWPVESRIGIEISENLWAKHDGHRN